MQWQGHQHIDFVEDQWVAERNYCKWHGSVWDNIARDEKPLTLRGKDQQVEQGKIAEVAEVNQVHMVATMVVCVVSMGEKKQLETRCENVHKIMRSLPKRVSEQNGKVRAKDIGTFIPFSLEWCRARILENVFSASIKTFQDFFKLHLAVDASCKLLTSLFNRNKSFKSALDNLVRWYDSYFTDVIIIDLELIDVLEKARRWRSIYSIIM